MAHDPGGVPTHGQREHSGQPGGRRFGGREKRETVMVLYFKAVEAGAIKLRKSESKNALEKNMSRMTR